MNIRKLNCRHYSESLERALTIDLRKPDVETHYIILLFLTLFVSFSSWAAARESEEPLGRITSLQGPVSGQKKGQPVWTDAASA